jgi:hypothetical protein
MVCVSIFLETLLFRRFINDFSIQSFVRFYPLTMYIALPYRYGPHRVALVQRDSPFQN